MEITTAKVKRITITNFRMIEHVEIDCGVLTILEGGNHQGKTSILDAIKCVLGGGHDPADIRDGQAKYEIVFEVETDKGLVTIKKGGTKKSNQTLITAQDGTKISKPMEWIEKLVSAAEFDPLSFLRMTDKERASMLTKRCRVKIAKADAERFATYPGAKKELAALPDQADLAAADALLLALADKRKNANAAADQSRAAADQLKAQLGTDEGETADMSMEELQAKLQTLQGQMTEEINEQTAHLNAKESAGIALIEADIQLKLDEIAKLRFEISSLQIEATKKQNEIKDAIQEKFSPQIAETKAAITVAHERAKNAAARQSTAKMAEQFEATAKQSTVLARDLDDAIKALRSAKVEAVAKVMPAGLTIEDGTVLYKRAGDASPVPFESTNQAEKMLVALEVSSIGTGKLPFMLLDGLEAMDAKTLAQFRSAVESSGMQMVAAKVTEGELTIKG